MSTPSKTLVAVFAVALIVRLSVLAMLPSLPDAQKIDPDSYHSLARHLFKGEGFVASNERGEVLPNVARTPVYPLFLMTLIKVGGDRLGLFFASQCVLGAVTCVLTILLARRWLSAARATIAGLAVALDPNSVVRCIDLRTETLFTLLLLAGACLIAWRNTKIIGWWIAGLLWSLAALCRPIGVWLWAVAAIVLSVSPAEVNWRQWATFFAAFLIGFAPFIGLWMSRNAELTGHPFGSTIATHNLLWYRASGVEAERTASNLADVQQEFYRRYDDVQFFKNRTRFDRELRDYRQTSFHILRNAPLLAAKQAARGWAMLLFGPGAQSLPKLMHSQQPSVNWWAYIYGGVLVIVTAASLVGAVRLGRASSVCTALVIYFVLLSGGPEANSRFRTPITPMLALLAVAAMPHARIS